MSACRAKLGAKPNNATKVSDFGILQFDILSEMLPFMCDESWF